MMKAKTTAILLVTGFLLSNILTTLWYALMDEANMVPFRREEPIYPGLMLTHIVFIAIMVHFFPGYYNGKPGRMRGFVFGCLMGTMMFLPQGIVVRSIWTVDFNLIFILNTVAHVLIGGIIGLVFTFLYSANTKEKTT